MAPSAPSEYAVSLGLLGWPLLLSRALGITSSLLFKTVRAAVSPARRHELSLYEYVVYEGMRDYQCGLNAVGIQNLLPSTSKTSRQYARKHGIPYSSIQLQDGTVALWLGPSKPAKVVVLFHGGGYMAPALGEHISFAFGFAKSPPKDVAVVVLQYALASEKANHYPRQLEQAISLMQHLLSSEKIAPSAITLLGDSAGAHLLLSLLLHVNHQNSRVSPLTVDGQFSGAALVSPWVELSQSPTSEKPTAEIDIIRGDALAYWAQNLLGGAASDPWNSPLTAPTEWWRDLPVDSLLITYGENEMFRDDAGRLCERIQASHPQTTALKCSGELHVHMIMNRFLHINKPCQSEAVFVDWLKQRLEGKAAEGACLT